MELRVLLAENLVSAVVRAGGNTSGLHLHCHRGLGCRRPVRRGGGTARRAEEAPPLGVLCQEVSRIVTGEAGIGGGTPTLCLLGEHWHRLGRPGGAAPPHHARAQSDTVPSSAGEPLSVSLSGRAVKVVTVAT